MTVQELGQSIPPHTAHAVSVSLPTWEDNVGYEEGIDRVLNRLSTGYPRFFIHKSVHAFADAILLKYGLPGEQAFLFPSHNVALRCAAFLKAQAQSSDPCGSARIINLYPDSDLLNDNSESPAEQPIISAVIFSKVHTPIAKTFWQHSGDGISSRRAEYCFKAFVQGNLAVRPSFERQFEETALAKGPRRYQRASSIDVRAELSEAHSEGKDRAQFVEERFGRNLNIALAYSAKQAIRRRIAGTLNSTGDTSADILSGRRTDNIKRLTEHDVYLYPCGMSSIFNTHRTLMKCRGLLQSISFGFPYIDTLKILQKWGPGCVFYGHGASIDLNDIADRCERGERFLALFCEFPGNPLLQSPDLLRIRSLADQYDFAVVIDETIGNFINVNILPYADIVVSSLTKVFTGECNVMGGSAILNPQGRYYSHLKKNIEDDYEDTYWPEDAIFMERNSRDFVSRIQRINSNAEALCDILKVSPVVKEVFYPKYSPTRHHYERCMNENGGYGGLLSVTFTTPQRAITFFDTLETAKGPSLGTNFTLTSPYVILAHYMELDWVQQFGVDPTLVRISVGLEDSASLCSKIEQALDVASKLPEHRDSPSIER